MVRDNSWWYLIGTGRFINRDFREMGKIPLLLDILIPPVAKKGVVAFVQSLGEEPG